MEIKQIIVNVAMGLLIAILATLLVIEKFQKETETNETIETIIEERKQDGSRIIDDSADIIDRIDIFLDATDFREHL